MFGDLPTPSTGRSTSLKLCREFYAGIGLPIDDVLRRSDLFEKPGKYPHAFSTDIDRQGDVRVLANVVPEPGVAGHDAARAGPCRLLARTSRTACLMSCGPSRTSLTTEGVAMMFEKLADNAGWLAAMGVTCPIRRASEAGVRVRRNRLLIFSRWCQVMFRFEMALYDNPDQDLNRLWWDLVENYQELKRPEGRDQPDYAARSTSSAPGLLSQLHAGRVVRVASAPCRSPATCSTASIRRRRFSWAIRSVGRFMRQRVFEPGCTLDWNQLTRHATGAT